MVINSRLLVLLVSLVLIVVMTLKLNKSNKKIPVFKYFTCLNITLILHTAALLLQILFSATSIDPIYFEYISYLGSSFTPIFLLFVAISYIKKEKYIKNMKLLYILPILFLVCIFTNDLHGLFYTNYSINLSGIEYGPMYYVYAAYSYVFYIISIVIMIVGTIKKSGVFSTSTLLLILGIIALIFGNVVSILQVNQMTVYIMPLMFIIFSTLVSISIFKYNSLKITPIALKTIMDTMTDAFVVISKDGIIVDSNRLFKETFLKDIEKGKPKDNLFEILSKSTNIDLKKLSVKIYESIVTGSTVKYSLDIVDELKEIEKYYEIDINPIKAKNKHKDCIGILLLIKNVTEHRKDLNELKEKQEVIVKQGQLVSIGEVAGGVAHDINTPISAIKTGIVMLKDSSVNEEQTEILDRMDNCATKIINIVNSMRNQIRNLGGDVNVVFKISDVVDDVKSITAHEISKYKATLEIDIEEELYVQGDPGKLGQVLTNLIMNAAQSYNEKDGGKIKIVVMKAPKNQVLIKVIDFGEGLDDSVKPYIFKSILTTKGIAGTGLGLYLAYSVIKGNFNGDITFDSEKGKGTTFCITIPRVTKTSLKNENVSNNSSKSSNGSKIKKRST